jgi:thioredoxin reductase (NADPH)
VSAPARELVVVGAGPAGVSAALWARSRDLDVLVLEAEARPGGQLHAIHFEPREIAGWPSGDGPALADVYARQLATSGIAVRHGARVRALEPDAGRALGLALEGGGRIEARAVLVATGARRRTLGVPGEREFEGRGVSTSATRDRAELAGRAVVVVGGGDAAFENALLLAGLGCDVTVLVRGAPRARREFRERLAAEPRARVLETTRMLEVTGGERVSGVRVAGPGGERRLACDAVVVKVGVVPQTAWCREALAHDADGYLRVDDRLATSRAGVWAAGDVVRPLLPSVPVAAGHGALAAAAIRLALRGD